MDKPKFGVFLPSYAFQTTKTAPSQIFNRICDVVLECERLGYDSVWLDDHLMYHDNPVLECWTTLSALAAVTIRIRLGTMVTCSGFRNPALLAKMAATVDVISNGRLELGVGAGVQKEEHQAFGFTFPKTAERISRLKETVEITKKLWTQQKASFTGRHYQIAEAACEPKPVQQPHPPIIVGGCGEKFTLKVTAQLADRLDFGYLPTMEQYKHKLDVLKNHCTQVGRRFEEIEKSAWPTGQIILASTQKEVDAKVQRLKPKGISRKDYEAFSFVGTPDHLEDLFSLYAALGVTHFMLFFADLPETDGLKLFAETAIKTRSP
ncbi:MAG: TIGR03560 family F420-dependent LLM class oxidoreductase [Candidatus Bathyarchaeota archaeon]|nr:TIGR03560 family F420-dependent LLM class oxidoreductase [Candidatus Bathyarchaeota archaeon]